MKDLYAAHHDSCKEIILQVELCVMFKNNTWILTRFTVRHSGFVTYTALALLKDSLSVYMDKPYYNNGYTLCYYQHVDCCLFSCIKNIVIKDL